MKKHRNKVEEQVNNLLLKVLVLMTGFKKVYDLASSLD